MIDSSNGVQLFVLHMLQVLPLKYYIFELVLLLDSIECHLIPLFVIVVDHAPRTAVPLEACLQLVSHFLRVLAVYIILLLKCRGDYGALADNLL